MSSYDPSYPATKTESKDAAENASDKNRDKGQPNNLALRKNSPAPEAEARRLELQHSNATIAKALARESLESTRFARKELANAKHKATVPGAADLQFFDFQYELSTKINSDDKLPITIILQTERLKKDSAGAYLVVDSIDMEIQP